MFAKSPQWDTSRQYQHSQHEGEVFSNFSDLWVVWKCAIFSRKVIGVFLYFHILFNSVMIRENNSNLLKFIESYWWPGHNSCSHSEREDDKICLLEVAALATILESTLPEHLLGLPGGVKQEKPPDPQLQRAASISKQQQLTEAERVSGRFEVRCCSHSWRQ